MSAALYVDNPGPYVAALYVDNPGPYVGLPDVDPWDARRDARLYAGPWRVIAHPPCARWGRMAEQAFGRRYGIRGDDGGMFDAALTAVRRWGGVLEHPEASSAWGTYGMTRPPRHGGWIRADEQDGWTCCVEQGHYGHRTRKATWLYANGLPFLPALKWGPSQPAGYRVGVSRGEVYTTMGKAERRRTPLPFRDLLLDMVRVTEIIVPV